MPPQDQRLRSMYPDNGWSSWFGFYYGTDYPSAGPYALTVRSPGSSGIFAPFTSPVGVKFVVDEITDGMVTVYRSSFQPPVGIVPASIALSLVAPGSTEFFCVWYAELGAPPFVYFQTTNAFWANMRKKLFLPGPGPPPLPLLSTMGPILEITPWNKRGFELLP